MEGNEGWSTEGRRRSTNINFVIRTRYGKITETTCQFLAGMGVESNTTGTLGEHLALAGSDGSRVDFLGKVRGGIGNRKSGRAVRRGRRHVLQ